MIIRSAQFVKSSPSLEHCPKLPIPEYAFIGRSNVGKSSLINMLTKLPKLAQVSGSPGKTRLINHFLINNNWYLVDLPGYGYARASKVQKGAFSKIVTDYIAKREELTLLFVLIDCRHEPQSIDIDFINKLGELGIPFSIIFTKADKLGKLTLENNIEAYKQYLQASWDELPACFVSSSEKNTGREEILNYIDKINQSI